MEKGNNIIRRSIKLSVRVFGEFMEHKMSVYSGYATLFIVTAMIPFIILIISIVNLIPGYSAKDVADILLQFLPDLEAIRDLVTSLINDIKNQSGGLVASAATVTTLWSASKGVMAIQKGLNQLDSEDESRTAEEEGIEIAAKGRIYVRGIFKRLFFTLMLVILIPAMFVFEMLNDAIAGIVQSVVQKMNSNVLKSSLENIDSFFDISSFLVVLLAFLIIISIFAYLPAKRRTLKSQLPGALLTSLCWFAFTGFFSVFIRLFYHSSYLYGVLASIFLLLMWIRYVVMILFAGSVLNHLLEEDSEKAFIQDPDYEPAR